jgi:hypothetical protein
MFFIPSKTSDPCFFPVPSKARDPYTENRYVERLAIPKATSSRPPLSERARPSARE